MNTFLSTLVEIKMAISRLTGEVNKDFGMIDIQRVPQNLDLILISSSKIPGCSLKVSESSWVGGAGKHRLKEDFNDFWLNETHYEKHINV